MYIKRNVYFSAIDQETGEEKLFSVNEIISESDYQKMFAEAAEEKKSSKAKTAAKVAGGTAAGATVLAGGAYGGEKLLNKAGEAVVKSVTGKRGENGKFRKLTANEKKIRDLAIKARDTKTIQNFAGDTANKAKEGATRAGKAAKEGAVKAGKVAKDQAVKLGSGALKTIKANPKTAAAVGLSAAATTGAGAYGVRKYRKHKSED